MLDNYNENALMVALALAHQDWIRMTAEPNAALDALPDQMWERFHRWEENHAAMQHAPLAAAVWIGHRTVSHMNTYFLVPPAETLAALRHRIIGLGDLTLLDTVLTGDAPSQSVLALELVEEYCRRWDMRSRGPHPI